MKISRFNKEYLTRLLAKILQEENTWLLMRTQIPTNSNIFCPRFFFFTFLQTTMLTQHSKLSLIIFFLKFN